MTSISIWDIKKEWVFFLRNNDVFTTTQRGVTTDSDTGTFASDSSYLIDKPNVKNVRSVVIDGTALTYGSDYTVNIDYDDSGTVKCLISFDSTQSGTYTIQYDYGTDKIFPDFPRADLKKSSFPRIGADIISSTSEINDFDGTLLTSVSITTVVYDVSIENINKYISDIDSLVNSNQKNFHYIGKFVSKTSIGPVLKYPGDVLSDKVFQQNIDIQGILNFER